MKRIFLLFAFLLAAPAWAAPKNAADETKFLLNLRHAGFFQLQGQTGQYDASGNLKVNCIIGCSASAGFTDNTAFTVGTSAITNIGAYFTSGADPACTSGNACRLRADASSNLKVNCAVGCSGSSFADNGAFTAGTTAIGIMGGWYSTAPTACTSGSACAPSLTSDRKLFVQDFQGTSPWVVSASGNFGVTQQTSPWVDNLTQVASTALGATAVVNYGSTPAAVAVPAVNAFITNTPTVTANAGSGTFTVGGTVTANAGTNLNTSSLQLDATGAKLNLAQASTTSGQTGPLEQCAVTTAAPTYTTAQTDPLSCNTSGGLRVDGSGVTQPVSGTVTANAGTGTFSVVGTLTNNNAAPAANNVGVLPVRAESAAPSYTTGNQALLSEDLSGNLRVSLTGTNAVSGTVTANAGTGQFNVTCTAANCPVNVAQVGGTNAVTAGVAGSLASGGSTADGSAIGTNPVPMAGKGSAVNRIPIVCDNWKPFSFASTTAQLLVTGAASKKTFVCSINIVVGAATNVALIEGTTTTNPCDTGTAGMAGGTTAATGWNFAANGGLTQGSGIGALTDTATAADSVCLLASAANQVSGVISWTQLAGP